MRLHKKKLNLLKQTKNILKKDYDKIFSLRFSVLFQRVLNLVRINLELKYRKYRKKEILIPSPVAPWKGLRLGLNLLLKNAQNSLLYTTKPRKLQPLYKLLTEMWDTFYGYSLTCQNILDFTNKVIDNFENYKSAQIFCVRKDRYNIFEKKVVIAKPKKKNTIHKYLRHILYLKNKNHKFFPESIKVDKDFLKRDKNKFKLKKNLNRKK